MNRYRLTIARNPHAAYPDMAKVWDLERLTTTTTWIHVETGDGSRLRVQLQMPSLADALIYWREILGPRVTQQTDNTADPERVRAYWSVFDVEAQDGY